MDARTFTSRLASELNCDQRQAQSLISSFASVLTQSASNLDSIAIPGFGNFVVIKQQERITIDKKTGNRQLVPPQIKIEFVASAMLKKQIENE